MSLAVAALAALALVYPSPAGPPDNGDFMRVFSAFSTGPEGLPAFADRSDPETFGQRYFYFYHRYWRLDHRIKGFTHPSSALACYLPGILLRVRRGYFDLAANAVAVVLLLAAGLYTVLRRLPGIPFAALGVIALVATDANIVGYLNSFFQESGAFVGVTGLTASLFLLWTRRQAREAALVAAFTAMLATAKPAYAIAAIAGIPVILGATVGTGERRLSKSDVAAGSVAVALLVFSVFSWTNRYFVADHAYHFLFTAALPRLAPAERGEFLRDIGIDPRFAPLSGKNAYQPDSHWRDSALAPRLTKKMHGRAIEDLLRRHPRAFLSILGDSLSMSGRYPALAFPSVGAPTERRPRWAFWSRFRQRSLRGARAYAAWLALLGVLTAQRRSSAPGSWRRFFALLSLGYGAASVLQIVISVLGNGFADIEKHHFLGNVLLDFALIAVVAGLAESVGHRRNSAWPASLRAE